ncbi:MAG: hypothetical protein EKK48_29955 [Candidatus Melainabacteria bacterium]|nr:MAG: hypothetical protein EKK48_29955 [Candidatus Melainabacteria bacterium]
MPAEVTEKSQPAPPAQAESGMSQAAQSAWAPGSNYFRLGAVCNDTFNQSLSTQYDGLPQCAIAGIGEGLKKLSAIGEVGVGVAADVASVVVADLQIGYEAITYPSLAEGNSDRLAHKLRELQTKYEPLTQSVKQGYEGVQHDLNDIGAQSNNDSAAYARLVTDPAQSIVKAIDKFTGQTPAEQVKDIFDQGTQIAVAAALGKAAALASGSCRLEEIAAKFDALFSKMEETKQAFGTQLEHCIASGKKVQSSDYIRLSKAGDQDGLSRPADKISESCNSVDRSYFERLPQRMRDSDKTAGILVADGQELDVLSGRKGPAQSMPAQSRGFDLITKTHAEGHAIAHMIQHGIKEAKIYINNNEICSSCEKLIPRMLPPGSKLEVHMPSGAVRNFVGEPR